MTITEHAKPPTMEDLFVDPRALPSPSASVLEIIRRADDPDVAMADIARLVESDVSVTVQVLRMANSALYSPSKEITTVNRALAALGLRTIKLLALTTSLRSLIPQQSGIIDLGEVRHRMVVTAAVARFAAGLLGPTHRDEAFVAGLLTGIGPVVLATEAPDVVHDMHEAHGCWPDVSGERKHFGFSADDVTVELVKTWGMPEIFADAIRHRRQIGAGGPGESGSDGSPAEEAGGVVGQCVRIATLAEPILTGRSNGLALQQLRTLLPEVADIEEDDVAQWLIDAEPVVTDAASMLQFRIPDDVSYAELLDEVAERLVSLQLAMEGQAFHLEGSSDHLMKRNDELEAEASTDVLTKLPNRRAFDRKINSLMEMDSPELGLLVLDLDHFKLVNDTYGHSVGDDVLRMVGSTLKNQTRGADFTARFGGEEFMMLIPSTTKESLVTIADRLRKSIAELEVPMKDGSSISVTASVGGAMVSSSPHINSARRLIEVADEQLYEAKQAGRDRTCVA